MFNEDVTKNEQTIAIYLKKAKGIIKKARISLNLKDGQELDARQLVAWLEDERVLIYKKTWRLYKSAVICYLEKNSDGSEEVLSAIDYLRLLGSEPCKSETDKTSSTKLKRFPWKDFQKITDHLRQTPGKWHLPLLDWIISASLTGLRPQEWVNSKVGLIGSEVALFVKNAKHTNGRAHGDTRTLLLGALAKEEIEVIKRHIERVKTWNSMQQYDSLYEGCALTLNYVSRKLWPNRSKYVTLYSCRHQFTANAKASGFSTEEIAAMMGHAVDTTATKHYGKKTAGNELLRVRALESDIEKVKKKFKKHDEKQAQRKIIHKEPVPKTQITGN